MTRRASSARWLVLLLVLAQAASAQEVTPSPGFKIGPGALHPWLQVDARYDSLVGYFNRNSSGQLVPSGELVLHFRPGVKFDLDTPSTFVGFNGSAEFLWFTGAESPGSRGLSRFHANVGLDTAFNKDGAVEVRLGDTMTRSDRTQNPALGIGAVSLFNNLYLQVPIHPGGGALEITPKVAWSVEFFERIVNGIATFCPEAQPACNPATSNYSNLNFGAAGKWKFFPRTAVLLDVNADWRAYFNDAANNKIMFRALAGMAGLLSPKISVTILGGYAGDFTNSSIHTFVGNAEFAYAFTPTARVAVGYSRTASPVPVIGSLVDDRGYLRGGVGFWFNRIIVDAIVSLDYLTFFGAPLDPAAPVPNPTRHDLALSANLTPKIVIFSWWDVALSYTLSYRFSEAFIGQTLQGLNFVRHEAMLRLDFHY